MAAATRQRARQRQRPVPQYRGVSGEIVPRNPADLQPHPRNSRTHTPDQIAKVAASIRKFGFNAPILVKGDIIVAGHARVDAAKLEKLAEVPTLDVSHMSDDEVRAYLIADNRHAENAGWDNEVLSLEAFDLVESGFEPFEMGFTGDEDFFNVGDGGNGASPPDGFPEVDEGLATQYQCPKCGYEWSGKPK